MTQHVAGFYFEATSWPQFRSKIYTIQEVSTKIRAILWSETFLGLETSSKSSTEVK